MRARSATLGCIGGFLARGFRQTVGCSLRIEKRKHHEIEWAVGKVERDDLTDLRVAATDIDTAEIE